MTTYGTRSYYLEARRRMVTDHSAMLATARSDAAHGRRRLAFTMLRLAATARTLAVRYALLAQGQ